MDITDKEIDIVINDNIINGKAHVPHKVVKVLEDKKLIESNVIRLEMDEYQVSFTQFANEIYNNGGWFKHVQNLEIENQNDIVKKVLELEKLKLDIKNSKRIYNTYWWTFGFSIISILYILLKIIQSIFPDFLKVLK